MRITRRCSSRYISPTFPLDLPISRRCSSRLGLPRGQRVISGRVTANRDTHPNPYPTRARARARARARTLQVQKVAGHQRRTVSKAYGPNPTLTLTLGVQPEL